MGAHCAYVDKRSAMQFVQTFVALCANAFDVRVKCLHSDGEFKGHKDLDAMCAQAGVIQELSTTETPQLNGEAERLMRTLVEAARTLCYGGNVRAHLWQQAMHYYVCVHNPTPRVVLEGVSRSSALAYSIMLRPMHQHLHVAGVIPRLLRHSEEVQRDDLSRSDSL